MKPRKWENSPADKTADRKGAKKLGLTVKAYEKTAADRAADAKAQAKLNRAAKKKRK